MWSSSYDLKKVKEHSSWISLNKFSARLSEANVCNWAYNATYLCNSLLEDQKLSKNPTLFDLELSGMAQKLRKNPTLFAIALSAAAQHMIYAALNLYTFCKKHPTNQAATHIDPKYRWEDWKAVFKEVETIENMEAKNYALAAVVAMDMAEELYNSRQTSDEREIAMGGMPELSESSIGIELGF